MSKIPVESPPRLLRFRVDHVVLPLGPPMHSMGVVTCDAPDARIEGWSLEIRGAAAFLVSPRGWKQGTTFRELTGKGELTVVGPLPMQHVTCAWAGDDANIVDKLQRFTSPPFARAAPVQPEERAVDAKDLGDA